jgi:DNA-directed RNA polymerase specialized sigma24 family protein
MAARKVSPEDWEKARSALEAGATQKEIAEALGVNQSRVSQRLGKRRVKLQEPEPEPFPT